MWTLSHVEQEKLGFMAGYLSGQVTMTDLCAGFGISRKAGYELLSRHALEGLSCVRASSRARLTRAVRISGETAEALVELRVHRPTWEPRSCWRI